MTLTWKGASDRRYAVESSEDLRDWVNVASGLGTNANFPLPAASWKFYRVRAEF